MVLNKSHQLIGLNLFNTLKIWLKKKCSIGINQGAYQVSKLVLVSIRYQIDTIFEENRYHLDTKILLNRYQFSIIELVHLICEWCKLSVECSIFFYLISLGRSGYSRWPGPWPMTVHGHQFSLRARSSRTAANCLTRTTVKVKVEGLCLLPGGHPSNHYRSQVLLNFWDLTGSGVSNTLWSTYVHYHARPNFP